MVMRLVPQEELLTEEEIQDLEEQELQARSGRARGGVDSEAEEVAEAQDGAVEEVVDEAGAEGAAGADGAPAVAEQSVDLPLLEALLLSTHHPLTAGRLAELL